MLLTGEIVAWKYEPLKLKLADRTWYKTDFLVVTAAYELELHEVKGGHWEDDARVKIKAAAAQHRWFRFIAVRAGKGGTWEREVFGRAA